MLLRARGTTVAHCPTVQSEARLPVSARSATCAAPGVSVALGSDGAACNNPLDPFREMRLACFLPRTRQTPEGLSAFEALRMATWGGARALRPRRAPKDS